MFDLSLGVYKREVYLESYLEPCQTSAMELEGVDYFCQKLHYMFDEISIKPFGISLLTRFMAELNFQPIRQMHLHFKVSLNCRNYSKNWKEGNFQTSVCIRQNLSEKTQIEKSSGFDSFDRKAYIFPFREEFLFVITI